jgi:hypothetical protein
MPGFRHKSNRYLTAVPHPFQVLERVRNRNVSFFLPNCQTSAKLYTRFASAANNDDSPDGRVRKWGKTRLDARSGNRYSARSHVRTYFASFGSVVAGVMISRLPSILNGRGCVEPTQGGFKATSG